MAADPLAVNFVDIHGHSRAYVRTGRGPALLLLHGLGCDHHTWASVIPALAKQFTVIAPDLLGHGASAKPRADYSLGGYANGMRDLLMLLGIDKVTVVGHSFGGGVAMQFVYQYPELVERVLLIAPGGIGPEVTPAIRAISTPGFHEVMGLLTLPGVRHMGVGLMKALGQAPLPHTRDLAEVADIYESFKDPRARAAIRHVVRGVVDWRGQIVTMADRAYLTETLPMCVVWGVEDRVIPSFQVENIRALAPHIRIELVPNAGHFVHKVHPERFVKILRDFVRTTAPSVHDPERMRRLLKTGPRREFHQADAGRHPVAPVQAG